MLTGSYARAWRIMPDATIGWHKNDVHSFLQGASPVPLLCSHLLISCAPVPTSVHGSNSVLVLHCCRLAATNQANAFVDTIEYVDNGKSQEMAAFFLLVSAWAHPRKKGRIDRHGHAGRHEGTHPHRLRAGTGTRACARGNPVQRRPAWSGGGRGRENNARFFRSRAAHPPWWTDRLRY